MRPRESKHGKRKKERTMTENVEFTPEQQAKIDEIVKQRVARERERFEKENGTEELRQQLVQKDEEIAEIRQEHFRADARRAVVDELAAHGVTEEGRIERVLRYADLDALERADDGHPRLSSIRGQLADISRDMPELLSYQLGTGSGRGSKERVVSQEKPLSQEEVEAMDESQINSNWDRVKAFMAGERS
jgi:hypothetical protein